MAVGTWQFPENAKRDLVKGDIDLEANMYLVLFLSTWTPTVAYATAHEHAAENGYTRGGKACALTISEAGGTVKVEFTPDNVEWTAADGNIVFRYAALVNTTQNKVVCYFVGDDTPADITVTDGNDLTISDHEDGVFTIADP